MRPWGLETFELTIFPVGLLGGDGWSRTTVSLRSGLPVVLVSDSLHPQENNCVSRFLLPDRAHDSRRLSLDGQNGRIRTYDPLAPNEVRYRATLHSEVD